MTKPHVTGTYQPPSAVREMFGRIAPRYDLLNHILSFNIDRSWRTAVATEFADILKRPGAKALDLCCGTGDLTLSLQGVANGAQVIGADFCHPMLVRAAVKGVPRVLEADALQLPFSDGSFDLLTAAFGFRNLADYDAGLREMLRVLRSGGRLGILECSDPDGLWGAFYRLYSKYMMPSIGGLISGDRDAYAYLPTTIRRFPAPDELVARMRSAGFSSARYRRFTLGTVYLHIGVA